ncbi:MAG: hypothetical protein ACRCUM_02745 [Mycoplasmoidaceae bacterium]
MVVKRKKYAGYTRGEKAYYSSLRYKWKKIKDERKLKEWKK